MRLEDAEVERQQAADALRESREKLLSIVENVGVGIVVISPEMEVLELNRTVRSWLPDIRLGEKLSCHHAFCDPPRDDPCAGCPVLQTLEDGLVHEVELERTTPVGPRVHRIIASPIRGADGQVSAVAEIVEDVTDRRRVERERSELERQLYQVQRLEAVGQLSAGLAHEFQNLLTAILGHAEVLRRRLESDPVKAREGLEMIEQVGQRAIGLAKSLLTFSREVPAEIRPVNLTALVHQSVRFVRRMMPASIEVSTELPDSAAVWVEGDSSQLQQAIVNLAINARDAMPEGGRLRIALGEAACGESRDGVETSGGFARLVVEDVGTGIAPEALPRVFDPFFTTKARGQGTGLGLSIVHGIVERHHGRVDVRSEPGKGSAFEIVLPRIPPASESGPARSSPAPPRGAGELVLVGEDNRFVRGTIVSVLAEYGYEVLAVGDGASLMEAFEQRKSDVRVVIVDVDLPRRSGLAFLAGLRERGDRIPVIALTGDPELDLPAGHGPQTVLVRKPFGVAELAGKVATMLGSVGFSERGA
ncbi:MAG: response regulator [Phycisphaerae bacterium]|nr:response regulator [Phycisphaerae bacterium]